MNNDVKTNLDMISFSIQDNCFEISSSENPEIEFIINTGLNLSEISNKDLDPNVDIDAEVYLLKCEHYPQSEIIELRSSQLDNSKNFIGYLIKLNALFEKDTILLPKKVQLFGFRAIVALLKDMAQIKPLSPNFRHDNSYEISEFYPEDLVVAIMPKLYLNKIENFNFIEFYSLDLYSKGLILIDEFDIKPNPSSFFRSNFEQLVDANRDGIKELKLVKLNSKISSLSPLKLFLLVRKYSENEFVTFHLAYQLLEYLKDIVLKKELFKIVEKDEDSITGYDVKTKISKLSSEKHRLKLLFNKYSKPSQELVETLFEKLNTLHNNINVIKNLDKVELNDIHKLIYEYRNSLIHNYYSIFLEKDPKEIKEIQREVNEVFECFLLSVLLSIKLD